MEIIPYFLASAIMVGAIVTERLTGNFTMTLFIPYVIIPIFDYLIPVDHSNLP